MDITKASHAIAAKGFVVSGEGELLIIKRRPNDVHNPSGWEVPGGRIEIGEDPAEGVMREVREENGLVVAVHEPLGVRAFTRDDGQHITMIIFRCTPETHTVVLSEEHTAFEWAPLPEARTRVHEAFGQQFDTYERYYTGR